MASTTKHPSAATTTPFFCVKQTVAHIYFVFILLTTMLSAITVLAASLYVFLSNHATYYTSDAVTPLLLIALSTWAQYTNTNAILYTGAVVFVTALASAGNTMEGKKIVTLRTIYVLQTIIIIFFVVYLSIEKPKFYYVPLLFSALLALKTGVWDQAYAPKNAKQHVR